MTITKRLAYVGIFLTVLVGPTTFAGVVVNDEFPFLDYRYVECAGEFGDVIQLSGSLHVLITETYDRSGGFRWRVQLQPKGVSGFGLWTGDTYRATGLLSQEIWQQLAAPPYGALPLIIAFVRNLNLIGERGNIIEIHDIVHITVDPNAQLRVENFNYNTSCR